MLKRRQAIQSARSVPDEYIEALMSGADEY
jgi:hypothetical protein